MSTIKFCAVCGKEFVSGRGGCVTCSDECRKIRKREQIRRSNERVAELVYKDKMRQKQRILAEEAERSGRLNFKSLDEVAALAREVGLSYGLYVGLKYLKGERI